MQHSLSIVVFVLLAAGCWSQQPRCWPEDPSCESMHGPRNQTYHDWLNNVYTPTITGLRAAITTADDWSAYDYNQTWWTKKDFIQPQSMITDRLLFDQATQKWTVKKFLDDLTARFDGIDSVLLWQMYRE
jgi:hypothetical protein